MLISSFNIKFQFQASTSSFSFKFQFHVLVLCFRFESDYLEVLYLHQKSYLEVLFSSIRYYVASITLVRALVYCNLLREVRLGGWGSEGPILGQYVRVCAPPFR